MTSLPCLVICYDVDARMILQDKIWLITDEAKQSNWIYIPGSGRTHVVNL